MSRFEKALDKILKGTSDANVAFDELVSLLKQLGFQCRIKGGHHIFYKENIVEILNLQEMSGKAKPYQVKQVRNILLKYKIDLFKK